MLSVNWKHIQLVKICMPCNFEVNLGVIALFSSFVSSRVRYCHHLASIVRPLTFSYFNLLLSKTTWPNGTKLGSKHLCKVLYKESPFRSVPPTNMAANINSFFWLANVKKIFSYETAWPNGAKLGRKHLCKVQTWHGWSLGVSLSKLCRTAPPSIQDGCWFFKVMIISLWNLLQYHSIVRWAIQAQWAEPLVFVYFAYFLPADVFEAFVKKNYVFIF